EVADVAARQQPVDLVLVAAARVALELDVVADEDAPGLATRGRVAVLVVDLPEAAARRLAGRARGLTRVARRRDRRPRALGRAVEVVEVLAEVVHPAIGD